MAVTHPNLNPTNSGYTCCIFTQARKQNAFCTKIPADDTVVVTFSTFCLRKLAAAAGFFWGIKMKMEGGEKSIISPSRPCSQRQNSSPVAALPKCLQNGKRSSLSAGRSKLHDQWNLVGWWHCGIFSNRAHPRTITSSILVIFSSLRCFVQECMGVCVCARVRKTCKCLENEKTEQ